MAQIKRVTMQAIAEACGLSRNTVSKIFNGRGGVPDSTKDLVMAKAMELGYFQSGIEAPAPANRIIALLTHSKPTLHSFGSGFITNSTDQLCRSGYNLKIFEINDKNYAEKSLPSYFSLDEISGILTVELFDRDYTQMICNLGIPVLLVDSYADAPSDLLNCDLVYMENFASSCALTAQMIASGAKTLGFVGDINHCTSFRERWYGFQNTIVKNGLPLDKSLCILADDSSPYGEVDWMLDALNALPKIPDGFVCCNDFIAIRVMQALRMKGLSVPEDVMLTGFDGSTEAEVVYPPLSTAKIFGAEIGRTAANLLMDRINDPTLPCRTTYVRTSPIFTLSTRRS